MKISIIGAGRLGGLFAYTIASRGLADEIILLDVMKDLAEGQAMDMQHAMAHRSGAKIAAGEYADIAGSDMVIVPAGKPRQPGQTRLDLAKENAKIVSSVAEGIRKNAPEAIVITVTNPMDVMNWLMWKKTGFPRERVIGSGGQLDSARLRTILAKRLGASAGGLEAFVLGEHGETQTPVLSRVTVSGARKKFSEKEWMEVREELRQTAIRIIEKKKATEFAPAACTADMVEAIAKDRKTVIPCSAVLEGEYGLSGLSIGVPCVLGRRGIEKIDEWKLEPHEEKLFREGAETLKKFCEDVEKTLAAQP
ncbi:MAG: L-lactate dehydrogenase [Candidatus Micrarchaeota archaeon]|nr:L-lactate dehydrogenase [Candidatus Micrarchaeota archaeon]